MIFDLHTELLRNNCRFEEDKKEQRYYFQGVKFSLTDSDVIVKIADFDHELIYQKPNSDETTKNFLQIVAFVNNNLYDYRNLCSDYSSNIRRKQ